MVSERGLEVLKAIVHDYVAIGEPVGSKAIVDRHPFGVSAATIRNVMSVLEDEELITAPHTSSGRVPTDKGYRLFVDRLQRSRPLTTAQREAISRFLEPAVDFDDVLQRAVRLLAHFSNQLAVVQYPSKPVASARRVELVEISEQRILVVVILDNGGLEQGTVEIETPLTETERRAVAVHVSGRAVDPANPVSPLAVSPDRVSAVRAAADMIFSAVQQLLEPRASERLVVAGTSNLVRTGDDFPHSVSPVLEAIEEQVTLLRLLGELVGDDETIVTSIGQEHAGSLTEASIVTGGFGSPGTEIARVGIIGPTRMDYASNMAAVRAVARYLSRVLSEDA